MPDKVLGVIPARYEDSSFPGKLLAPLGAGTVLESIYQTARQAQKIDHLVIGTDDERIREVAEGFGAEVLITAEEHRTGTDRLTEVAEYYGAEYSIVANIHGNLAGASPELIDGVIALLRENDRMDMTTAARPFAEGEDPLAPKNVKVVLTKKGRALYFSRSLLPFPREKTRQPIYRHIGIYAYRRDFLMTIQTLPASGLEEAEALEQLRVLENDHEIGVYLTRDPVLSIDSQQDLQAAARL